MSKDLKGRRYAMVATTTAGDYVESDGDFTCMGAGTRLLVRQDREDGPLYVECAEGHHDLAGQVQQDYYLGFYPVKKPQADATE